MSGRSRRRASASLVRSITSRSAPLAAAGSGTWCTSWPAARSAPSTFEPNSRSGQSRATLATSLHAPLAELLAHGLRAPPHLCDLDAARAHLARHELADDVLVVEQRQRAAHGLRRGR